MNYICMFQMHTYKGGGCVVQISESFVDVTCTCPLMVFIRVGKEPSNYYSYSQMGKSLTLSNSRSHYGYRDGQKSVNFPPLPCTQEAGITQPTARSFAHPCTSD